MTSKLDFPAQISSPNSCLVYLSPCGCLRYFNFIKCAATLLIYTQTNKKQTCFPLTYPPSPRVVHDKHLHVSGGAPGCTI